MSDTINVKVKMTSNNQVFEIATTCEASILEFKQAVSEKSGLTEKEQNLVYKGKILSDEKLVKDYNIQNDHTIILVKKFVEKEGETKTESKPTTTTTTTTNTSTQQNQNPFNLSGLGGSGGFPMGGGLGGVDPSQLQSMMNNPMYMNMMNEMLQDPNTLNMLMNSPQLKPLLDSNPQLRMMMSNPQMMQSLMNPQNLQNAMNMMGGMGSLGGLGGLPSQTGQTQQNQNPNPFENFGSFSKYFLT
jgi:ubiquilin